MDDYYLLLEVQFVNSTSKKTYFYLTNDKSIKSGDYVAVDSKNGMEFCYVLSVTVYSKSSLPIHYSLLKYVIGKVSKDVIKIKEDNQTCNYQSKNYYYDSQTFYSGENGVYSNYLVLHPDNPSYILGFTKQFTYGSLYLPDGFKRAELAFFNKRPSPEDIRDEFFFGGSRLDNIKEVYIPEGYDRVYLGQVSLTLEKLYISNGVKFVTFGSFAEPSRLEKVYIPRDLETIFFKESPDYVKRYCFSSNVKEVFIDSKNSYYSLTNGILTRKYKDVEVIVWYSPFIQEIHLKNRILPCFIRPGTSLFVEDKDIIDLLNKFDYTDCKYSLDEFSKVVVDCKGYDEKLWWLKNGIIEIPDKKIFVRHGCRISNVSEKDNWFLKDSITADDFSPIVDYFASKYDLNYSILKPGIGIQNKCFYGNSILDIFLSRKESDVKGPLKIHMDDILEFSNGVLSYDLLDSKDPVFLRFKQTMIDLLGFRCEDTFVIFDNNEIMNFFLAFISTEEDLRYCMLSSEPKKTVIRSNGLNTEIEITINKDNKSIRINGGVNHLRRE